MERALGRGGGKQRGLDWSIVKRAVRGWLRVKVFFERRLFTLNVFAEGSRSSSSPTLGQTPSDHRRYSSGHMAEAHFHSLRH